jgi:hypothetical protein
VIPRNTLQILGLLASLALLAGCEAGRPYDYTAYRAHPPKSILVLPPINQSTTVEGTYSYLSTISQPLAERGYYVFPVAVIDRLMQENGLPSAGEMHEVPPAKLHEITGADAVLYLVLQQYGSKFQVITTTTTVQVSGRLVDTRTGTLLWEGTGLAQQGSNGNSSGNIFADIIAAAIIQAINSKTDPGHQVSRMANVPLLLTQKRELPPGPYLPAATRR